MKRKSKKLALERERRSRRERKEEKRKARRAAGKGPVAVVHLTPFGLLPPTPGQAIVV
jgi:hypothetical protein